MRRFPLLSLNCEFTRVSHRIKLWMLLGCVGMCLIFVVSQRSWQGYIYAVNVWNLLHAWHSCIGEKQRQIKRAVQKVHSGTDKCFFSSRIFVISCMAFLFFFSFLFFLFCCMLIFLFSVCVWQEVCGIHVILYNGWAPPRWWLQVVNLNLKCTRSCFTPLGILNTFSYMEGKNSWLWC